MDFYLPPQPTSTPTSKKLT